MNYDSLKSLSTMDCGVLKSRKKNVSVLWEHARKVFCENGSVKYIKCSHCTKTYSTSSNGLRHLKKCNHCTKTSSTSSNGLRHLKSTHSKQLKLVMDSKKNPSYTYGLKCEIVKKL